MTESIRHRGPDDSGVWLDPEAGIAFGHRRLSIIDLSPMGHQPMESPCGRYVMVYNGEIYNFEEIAAELRSAGMRFRGHSDTEVMLGAMETWGLEPAIQRFAGMFAFALWDRKERRIHLVRDRLGEKPLYFGRAGSSLVFASELKALRAAPGFSPTISRGALSLFARYNYVPAPHSIYEGVHKVLPGTIVTLSVPDAEPEIITYWSARVMTERGIADPLRGSESEVIDEFEAALRRTIRQEMIADVPLGAFLSGGIDSSTVVAIMQSESARPIRTFTIGFHETDYNEADQARAVAKHLGSDHTELYVSPEEAMAVVPKLPILYDEPFGDSSQVPTFLVSQLARESVTVSLSGDGGDEMLGGYNRYFLGRRLWNAMAPVPPAARRLMGRGMRAVSAGCWDRLYRAGARGLPAKYRLRVPGDKIHKLAGLLGVVSPDAMYRELVSHWREPASLVVGGHEPDTAMTGKDGWPAASGFVQRMMFLDTVSYLPDDIMVKVDRAAMGVSLETRAPFLDHRLAELAWRVPLHLKLRDGQGKWLLRQILYRHVPRSLVERPKMGFGIPVDRWLRGPLRAWAEALIDPERLRREGFLDSGLVQERWKAHQRGDRNWQYALWGVLMFQAWLEQQQS